MSEIIINGKWFLPGSNKKVGGILKIDTKLDENLILELSDILEMTDQDLKTIFNNKIKHINLILGETTNGDKITLINSIILQRESRGILKPEIIKQIFDVQMIINDIHLENIDYKFTSFSFSNKKFS